MSINILNIFESQPILPLSSPSVEATKSVIGFTIEEVDGGYFASYSWIWLSMGIILATSATFAIAIFWMAVAIVLANIGEVIIENFVD